MGCQASTPQQSLSDAENGKIDLKNASSIQKSPSLKGDDAKTNGKYEKLKDGSDLGKKSSEKIKSANGNDNNEATVGVTIDINQNKQERDSIPQPEELRSSSNLSNQAGISKHTSSQNIGLSSPRNGGSGRRQKSDLKSHAEHPALLTTDEDTRDLDATPKLGAGVSPSSRRTIATMSSTSSLLSMTDMMKRLRSVIISREENHALVFIKPHAVNRKMRVMVEDHLASFQVYITSEGILEAEDMNARGTIDNHYAALAESAMKKLPSELVILDEKKKEFKELYGLDWDECIKDGSLKNLKEIDEQFQGVDPEDIEKHWNALDVTLKLAPGNYVARLEFLESRPEAQGKPVFVVNGFYAGLRNQFLKQGARVIYFTVEWKELELPWTDFRTKVIGDTDPSSALPTSLRGRLFQDYQSFGLIEPPTKGNNGVHASAGPMEALKERITWLGTSKEEDPFYIAMKREGIPDSLISRLCNNEVFTIWGRTAPAYDLLEELDSSEVIEVAAELAGKRKSSKQKSEVEDLEDEENVHVVRDEDEDFTNTF